MVHAGGRLGLPPKPGDESSVARVVGGQYLHRDRPSEDPVGGPVHLGHPALAEGLLELVPAAEDGGFQGAQSPPPLPFPWCSPFPCLCSWCGGGGAGGDGDVGVVTAPCPVETVRNTAMPLGTRRPA